MILAVSPEIERNNYLHNW